jgi:hypothetical protein
MPPVVIPNSVLARLIWTKSGEPYAVNVLGATKAGGGSITQAVVNTFGSAVKSTFTASGLAPLTAATVSLQSVALRDISAANFAEFVDTNPAVPGTATTDCLPPQVAMVVTLRTALAGKSYRGRVYIPGAAEENNTATGLAALAYRDAAVAFVGGIANAFAASGLTFSVLSRTLSIATPVAGIVTRDATWDTVRKRAVAGI